MQYSSTVVSAATLFSMVQAVIITNTAESFTGVTAGQPLEITWSGATGPVSLTLKNGPSTDLDDVLDIASGQTGTSYTWTPPSTLPPDTTYAIEIEDSTDTPNYTVQFAITGGTGSVPSYKVSSAPTPVASVESSAPATHPPYTTAHTTSAPHPAPTVPGNATTPVAPPVASASPSISPNGTMGTPGPYSTNPAIAPPNDNSAGSFASPLAFVFLAFAGLLTLN